MQSSQATGRPGQVVQSMSIVISVSFGLGRPFSGFSGFSRMSDALWFDPMTER
jgi:hypothetical protein